MLLLEILKWLTQIEFGAIGLVSLYALMTFKKAKSTNNIAELRRLMMFGSFAQFWAVFLASLWFGFLSEYFPINGIAFEIFKVIGLTPVTIEIVWRFVYLLKIKK